MSNSKESTKLFGSRLTEAMIERNVSSRKLSQMTGISDSNLSRYKRGEYAPKRENIYKLANALNVEPLWLLGLSDQSKFVASEKETIKKELAILIDTMNSDQIKKTITFIKKFVI